MSEDLIAVTCPKFGRQYYALNVDCDSPPLSRDVNARV